MTVSALPFDELLSFVVDNRGRTCPTTSTGLPLIATNCISNDHLFPTRENVRYVDEETYHNWFRAHPKSGDIVFVLKGAPGRCALVPDLVDFCIAQDMVAVRANHEKVDPHYLFAALRSPLIQDSIDRMHVGTMIPHFKKSDFNKLLIPVPDRPVQEFIGSVHLALLNKIELNRRMNETLEAMARAIFKDWLVDFGPTRAKMEFRAPYLAPDIWSLFPDRLDEDGKPEGWSATQLDQVVTVLETGVRPKGGVSSYRSGVPSVGAESITGLGKFDFGKTKYIPEQFFESMKKGHVQSRDVLLYKDGGKPGLFEPHVTIFGDGFPFTRFAINEHVYRIRVKEDFGQNCLYFWLSDDSAKAEMRIKGTGAAIPGLNSTQARSLSVIVPRNGVARRLDSILEPFVARVLANCNESRTLAATRDFLLPKLMSGEVSVKDAEKMVGEQV